MRSPRRSAPGGDIDPAVAETDVRVPGEGLFVLAEEFNATNALSVAWGS